VHVGGDGQVVVPGVVHSGHDVGHVVVVVVVVRVGGVGQVIWQSGVDGSQGSHGGSQQRSHF